MPVTRSVAKRAEQIEAARASLVRAETHVTVCPSATGQGTHTRWHHPQLVDADNANSHPLFSLSPLSSTSSFPSEASIDASCVTPAPQQSFDAGSVIRTPVKKLQRNTNRIGFDGVPFWRHDISGIEEQVVFQPDGYTIQQAIDRQRMEELRSFRNQLDNLIQDKMVADLFVNDSSYTEIEAGLSTRRFGHDGSQLGDTALGSPLHSGRCRPKLGRGGTHLLGSHGTELFHSQRFGGDSIQDGHQSIQTTRPLRAEPTIVFEDAQSGPASMLCTVQFPSMAPPLPIRCGAPLGPHGTEIIDLESYIPPARDSLYASSNHRSSENGEF